MGRERVKHFNTEIMISVFLVLCMAAVYGQVSHHEFISFYDDHDYIMTNPHVQAGLTLDSIRWAFTTRFHSQWHPVTWLSHMADAGIFGNNAGRHHLTSLFFHMANTLLLFFFLVRVTRAPVKSAVVAALFAVHPIHAEPVAMVSYRKDLLCAFFWMLCLHAYVNYAQKGGVLRYCLVFVLFVFGLMAKTVIIALPLILLVLDVWPLCRLSPRTPVFVQDGSTPASRFIQKPAVHLMGEKLLLLVPMIVFAPIAVLSRNPGKSVFAQLPTPHHLANGLVSYLLYIRNTLWPVKLSVTYPPPGNYPLWQVSGSAMFILLITWAVIRLRNTRPYLLTGWFWFLITLLPVIGILGFMGPHQIADRYVYIPVTGLFIMGVWGGEDLLETWRIGQRIIPALTGGLMFFLMAFSWIQTGYWKNDCLLFTHAVRIAPDNYKAQNNLGMALAVLGKNTEAEAHLRTALRIKSDFVQGHLNLGVLLDKQGKINEAEHHFSRVLTYSPDNAHAHNNLGLVLNKTGRTDEAIDHFNQAIQKKPKAAPILYNLGNALVEKGELDHAVQCFQKAGAVNPTFAEAENALGYALVLQGKIDEAIVSFRKALTIDPDYEEARDNLDRALELTRGRGDGTF